MYISSIFTKKILVLVLILLNIKINESYIHINSFFLCCPKSFIRKGPEEILSFSNLILYFLISKSPLRQLKVFILGS